MTAFSASAAKKVQLDFKTLPVGSTPIGVDLWFLDFSEFAQKLHAEFSAMVSSDELIRANQFKKNATHFLATRVLLRNTLSYYTGLSAQKLLFERAEHGKPFLSNSPIPIHFNLSHCNEFAVLAVNTYSEIGVDIEIIHKRDYLKIAQRYFHSDELQDLTNCTEAEREILFYKLWTLKEAFFKATGGGISSGLDKIYFQFNDNRIKANFNPTLHIQENEWQFHQEFIASNLSLALVLNSTKTIKHQWLDGNAFLKNVK